MNSEMPFLQGYDGRSTDQLLALEGQFRIDSLVLAFEDGLSRKSAHTPQEQVVLAVEAIEREVNNGGFHQFFANASREWWPLVVNAFNEIRCPAVARLCQQAIEILGIRLEMSLDEVEAAACDASEDQFERLHRLDDEYYRRDYESIEALLFEFIKRNRQAIALPQRADRRARTP